MRHRCGDKPHPCGRVVSFNPFPDPLSHFGQGGSTSSASSASLAASWLRIWVQGRKTPTPRAARNLVPSPNSSSVLYSARRLSALFPGLSRFSLVLLLRSAARHGPSVTPSNLESPVARCAPAFRIAGRRTPGCVQLLCLALRYGPVPGALVHGSSSTFSKQRVGPYSIWRPYTLVDQIHRRRAEAQQRDGDGELAHRWAAVVPGRE